MKRWTTVVSASELARHIDDCVVIDCRHDLFDFAAGRRGYDEGHIPSARFLDIESDLSGPKTGKNGRHPMPERSQIIATFRRLGISDDTQIVAYDAQGGQMAGRIWCLARWLGHDAVAIIDGDIRAWEAAGLPLTRDIPADPAQGALSDRPSLLALVEADELWRRLQSGQLLLIDARAPERFCGVTEPIDPVAGHIPGAVNRFFGHNLRPDNRLKPPDVLRQEFEALLAGRAPSEVFHHCGSGVTACANLLAMSYAGLEGSGLYAGSWSEWIADPSRPVATGG
ncbi:MAG: sulfurtransferase [Burkholderiaceae bacterium]